MATKTSTKSSTVKAEKTAAAKTETASAKPNGNGHYDFLVEHFANPSTVVDAAIALSEHSKIDPNITVKKVENFLENAKIDRSLEVKAGTGTNNGQFLIARVPQSAQRKETSVKATAKKTAAKKTAEKKTAEKNGDRTLHLKVTEGTLRAGNKRGAAIQFWTTGYHTIETAVSHLAKQFPDQSEGKLRSAATEIFRNAGLRDRLKVKVQKQEKGGQTTYTVVSA